MQHPVILIADPGIDGAFAIALALHDPSLNVLGLAATAGNVTAEQATNNVQMVVEQLDPPRWPRFGAAVAEEYPVNGLRLHGPGGLGGVDLPCAGLHHPHPSDKLLIDLVRQNPHEATVIVIGPFTTLARAFDRDPELPGLVKRIVAVGGAWHEPGNVSAVAEFHVYCDPLAARKVVRCGAPVTLIPLDVTRRLLFSPTDLLELPNAESRTCQFLRRVVPFGIRATSNTYGLEGFHLKDVLGIIAVSEPSSVSTKHVILDVELSGHLTKGMTVIDARPQAEGTPNVDLAVGVDLTAVRKYIRRILEGAG